MEKSVRANINAIGIKELRQLVELSRFNQMLISEEFMKIISVYNSAIDRVVKEAKEQRVEI